MCLHGRHCLTPAGAREPVCESAEQADSSPVLGIERDRGMDEDFDRLRGEIAHAFADATVDDVQALTDEAVKAARRHRDT